MEFVNRQQSLLGELANVVSQESENGYEKAVMVLTARPKNSEATSMELYFEFTVSGETKNAHLSLDNDDRVDDAAFELHELMRRHTGGSWSEMTLTLTSDGQLKTEFKYPDAS